MSDEKECRYEKVTLVNTNIMRCDVKLALEEKKDASKIGT